MMIYISPKYAQYLSVRNVVPDTVSPCESAEKLDSASSAADNRNHVSGTTPLSLAATVGLLSRQEESLAGLLDNCDEARDLFTALFMPKFFRSDYHSLAEIQAGIDHFMAEHAHRQNHELPQSQEIDPVTARQRAYSAMCRATCDEDSRHGITPRRAMEDYCVVAMNQTQWAAF